MSPDRYEEFAATRYWPQLDGLRVVSIALVLVAHMGDTWVPRFHGALGVVVFFVISGFLITSLLIREEARRGSISLTGFYIRRFFRIVPMYALALAVASILVLQFGFGEPASSYLRRLPYLATFNGDLTVVGTFVHSWSIGVEEKYYIVWPLVGFAILPLARRRLWIAGALLLVCSVLAFTPGLSYFGSYTGILAGCVLAILMHDPRTYPAIRRMAGTIPGIAFTLLAVAMFLIDVYLPWNSISGNAHVPFAYAVALAFPFIVIGSGRLRSSLAWKPLAFVGTRTYGIYLFHVFCIDVVNRVWPDGESNPLMGALRLGVACTLTYLVAEILYRVYEQPLIRVGRRLTGSSRPERSIPAEPTGGRPVVDPAHWPESTRPPAEGRPIPDPS
ncbi:acyltransferase family protein [Microbacterium sp. F51-2R]|uniref:acyltransferase family protein n=1 Tax=Microbacterium sp. F51-2R TaxID=3445777 RepID=UPI003FA12A72